MNDPHGRNDRILSIFVENGAPEEILYQSKPHIGTDILAEVVQNMRKYIISRGGEVRFHSKVTDLVITREEGGGKLSALKVYGNKETESNTEVLEAEIPGGTRPAAAPEVIHLEAAETTILVIQVIFPMEPSTAAMETMAARVS